MVQPDDEHTEMVPTTLGTLVPRGSMLSHHLAITEGDFAVGCDASSFQSFDCTTTCSCSDLNFPPLPIGYIGKCKLINVSENNMEFVDKLFRTKQECHDVEVATRDQSSSDMWWQERQFRLTASNFAEVYNRKRKDCSKLVERLTKSPTNTDSRMPASLKHGREYEDTAARKYERYMTNIDHPVRVEPCGLVLRPDNPVLGCSPDRRVTDPKAHPHYGIVEIKCPYHVRGITPLEAAQVDTQFCCEMDDQKVRLKRSHAYYIQVQGQMALTGTQWCDFVVYTFKGLHVERIAFDALFWNGIWKKLMSFYFEKFLPVVNK